MKRTRIIELLQATLVGQQVNVKGWVRTRRGNKAVSFIALNDGSTIHNIQIVVDLAKFDPELLAKITTGASLSVIGELVSSQGQGQSVEIQASEIEVLGTCQLQQKKFLIRKVKRCRVCIFSPFYMLMFP